MKTAYILLLALLLSRSVALSATLEQLWPWVSPHPLALGISFAEFKQARPAAISMDLSGKELKPGEPFEGGLFEKLPDGSIFAYSFFEDKFVAANWGAPTSPENAKLLLAVRKALLETCGEPIYGTTGRIKGRGGIARIVWEQYRPRIDNDYVITLNAASENGIDVAMVRESDARKRNIKITPPTYEEVVQSLPASVQSGDSASVLVDLLNEARSGRLTTSLEAPNSDSENKEPANPTVPQPPAPEKPIKQQPAPVTPVEETASSTGWLVVAVIVAALGLLGLLHKKRK